MILAGTLINTLAIAVGGGLGLACAGRFPNKLRTAILTAIGLGTLAIGMKLTLTSQNLLCPIAALALGGATGTMLRISDRIEGLAAGLKTVVRSDSATFVEGFLTASLLFCVGPMTILGSIQDGMGQPNLLYLKSCLDGLASLALAATLGSGVLFAALSVLFGQGALGLAARALAGVGESRATIELNATGGLLILAIGLGLLELKKIPVADFLPALALAPLLGWLAERLGA